MKNPKIKRSDIEKIYSKIQKEDNNRWLNEFNSKIYKRVSFESNIERNFKINKILKELGEKEKYVDMKFVILRVISNYILQFGIQRGDIFNVDLEKEQKKLIKQLKVLDNFQLNLLLHTFQGIEYKYREKMKLEHDYFLNLIENYDEIDFGSPESLGRIGMIEKPKEYIDKLFGKFERYVDPYYSAIPKFRITLNYIQNY